MCDVSSINGLAEVWAQTRGVEDVRVAVIDGAVDVGHPVFLGAAIDVRDDVWPEEGFEGPRARHGTLVASVLFGQHGGPVTGVAPGCRGLSVPVFSDAKKRVSQLDLARGIEYAVESGAHVINLSGGEFSESGEADDLLNQAVRLCADSNVLLVAAAGNDGCFCAHVPAAVPSVLAVGALDDAGSPLGSSNWGSEYSDHGILAPGEDIHGAVPGGDTERATGTSLATPIVAGVAALLLSLQVQRGGKPDPLGVREILLASADPCELGDEQECRRYLSGKLNIRRAVSMLEQDQGDTATTSTAGAVLACEAPPAAEDGVQTSCGCGGAEPSATPPPAARAEPAPPASSALVGVTQSAEPIEKWEPYVYALGTLGYDFGTEARRDTFKQLMPAVTVEGGASVPANPYDARQMVDHLTAHASEARSLIWTLNLELTPIYAVEAVGPYASEVYGLLSALLGGEIAGEEADDYIERVSVPGRLTNRSARLFSGQVVPIIEVEQVRGLHGWQTNELLNAATAAAEQATGDAPADEVRRNLREFLTKVYYDLRNLGSTSRDRALNFAVTNAFQAANTFASALAARMALDTINVERSPFGRIDSDCWDVKLRFFDPENSKRAKKVFRFTIDVSDPLPVTLGEIRTWSEA